MIGTIIGVVLAVILGIWLITSAFGLLVHVLGFILLVAAVIWLIRALTTRGGNSV